MKRPLLIHQLRRVLEEEEKSSKAFSAMRRDEKIKKSQRNQIRSNYHLPGRYLIAVNSIHEKYIAYKVYGLI